MIKLDEKNLMNNEYVINNNESFFIDNIKENNDVKLSIKNNSDARISFLGLNDFRGNILVTLDKNCSVEIYYADFAKYNIKCKVEIHLEEGSKCIFHLASLTTKDYDKNFNICVFHDGKNSYSFVDNYGVVKNEGKLIFDGVSYIKNGCVKSKTRQNANIMVFDKNAIGIAKPILKIDENDIEASHGAVVGKISDEHLFYLESRGLNEDQAKVLITYGYLKPIMNGFDNEARNTIEKIIEERA